MLSHHLCTDCPKTSAPRTTPAERRTIGAMIATSALIVVLALQADRAGSGEDLSGIIDSDAASGSVSITGR